MILNLFYVKIIKYYFTDIKIMNYQLWVGEIPAK